MREKKISLHGPENMEPDKVVPPVKNQPAPAKVKTLLMAVVYKVVKLLCGKKLEGHLERVRSNNKNTAEAEASAVSKEKNCTTFCEK